VDRVHEIWLRLTGQDRFGSKLHHRDVVGVALRRLERDLQGENREQLLNDIATEMQKGPD
jgi:hypothetical protein